MESSDDEGEALTGYVLNYYFEDDKREPVSFSVLPIQWSGDENLDSEIEGVFLHGLVDNGLRKIYKPVIAWKFDLSNVKAEILVLSKEKNGMWIKLQKPRKSYEDTIRTILITVHALHFVKRNPSTSSKALWDNLSKVFSTFEIRPSINDLLDHVPILSEAVKKDAILATSTFLLTFLEECRGKRKTKECQDAQILTRPAFIVDVDDYMIEAENESDDEDDVFDSVCAFCDNGGTILCCEGRCMRSFHATVEDGEESLCASLGYSQGEVDAIHSFICKNCEYKQHQCFVCGKLGSSDRSSNTEVFLCVNATCGRFYHSYCVSKILHQGDVVAAKELEEKILKGESFLCPTHKCSVCGRGENKKIHVEQFAVCRRCPISYHRKCLPREISFEDIEEEGIITRAWEDLLPNRILIYCLKHELDDELGTPLRDHIKFPDVKSTLYERNTSLRGHNESLTGKTQVEEEKIVLRKKNPQLLPKKDVSKEPTKPDKPSVKNGLKMSNKTISGSDISRKVKVKTSSMCVGETKKPLMRNLHRPLTEGNRPSLGEQLFALVTKGSKDTKSDKQGDGVANESLSVEKSKVRLNTTYSLDADTERRLLALMKEAASSITLEEVVQKRKVASTHAYSLRTLVEKTITVGKLEGSVNAVRTALRKLEEGCSIEDAEAVCGPDVLNQIFRWKDKLKVYLAPFLFGNRYTSFGRHFTQMKKLEGIVEKLHHYVKNGDTLVDFCCGANDFSILMSKKLEETGKRCLFKNYDLLPTKNDFCFEMRDWMTVKPDELPDGSELVMGLNPPFGMRASLANKFIDKALEFKPKLLVLIVPPETQRLDEKRSPYDLVWEDDKFLSGKSFYLPGSVDVYNKQLEQWNVKAPLLYLWSHPDWTAKHMVIAHDHAHLPEQNERTNMENLPSEYSAHHMDPSLNSGNVKQTDEAYEFRGQAHVNDECQKEGSVHSSMDRENQDCHNQCESQSDWASRKRKHSETNISEPVQVSAARKRDGSRLIMDEEQKEGVRCNSDSNIAEGEPRVQDVLAKSMPPQVEVGYNTPQYCSDDSRLSANEMCQEQRHDSHANISKGGSLLEDVVPKPTSPLEVGDKICQPFPDPQREFGNIHDRSHRSSNAARSHSDYRARNLGVAGDAPVYRHYNDQAEEKHSREAELRRRIRLYGHQEPDPLRNSYLDSHDPGYGLFGSSSYSYEGLGAGAEFRSGSTMQRYAPRLDELNRSRMSSLGPDYLAGGNDIYDRRGVLQPGRQGVPLGFAPGPHQGYSRQSSAGWLND